MRKQLARQLIGEHPELYASPNMEQSETTAPFDDFDSVETQPELRIRVGDGWFQPLAALADVLANMDERFPGVVVNLTGATKSWCGGLEVFIGISGEADPAVLEQSRTHIDGIIAMARGIAERTCPICGEPSESPGTGRRNCKVCCARSA